MTIIGFYLNFAINMGVDGPCWAIGIPEIPGMQDGRSTIERLIAGARKKEQDWGRPPPTPQGSTR
jgi:hypothetical protein